MRGGRKSNGQISILGGEKVKRGSAARRGNTQMDSTDTQSDQDSEVESAFLVAVSKWICVTSVTQIQGMQMTRNTINGPCGHTSHLTT
jgi:hypothetical protein